MSEMTVETQDVDVLGVGERVEVRSHFDRRWTRGFSVAAVADDAVQLRRDSDGSVLPAWFATADVRPASVA